MRTTAGMLLVGLAALFTAGCSSGRWGLAKHEPPKTSPGEDVKVTYGNPWGKPKDKVATPDTKAEGLPPELEAKLAESRARRSRDGDSADQLRLAAEAVQKGDLATAKVHYNKVLDADPRNAEAHHRLGVIADQQQDQNAADQHYQLALAANRKDADLLSDIGYSYFLRGDMGQSERYLKEALEVNQYHRLAQAHLGRVYAKQGKYDAALASFRQVATENEALKLMAQYFPEGRPGSNLPIASEQRPASPMREIADARGSGLPPWAVTPAQPQAAQPAPPQQASLQHLAADLLPSSTSPPQPSSVPPNSTSQSTMLPMNAPATNPVQSFPAAPTNVPTTASTNPSPTFWSGNDTGGARSSTAPSAQLAGPPAWNTPPAAAPAFNAPEFQPANYETRPATPASPWGEHLAPATTQVPSSDAARVAAQMAMNAGPGAMFPVVTPGPTAAPILQAAATDNGQNRVQWAYGEQPPANAAPTVQQAVAWGDPNASTNAVQQGAWKSDLAPPSPWNDWQSPAPPSNNWVTPQPFGQPPASTAPPNPLPQDSMPPQWPGASQGTIVQPANPPAMMQPAPVNNASPQPTTISNWPYAPGR